jgi:large subunit ribosomal protein L24
MQKRHLKPGRKNARAGGIIDQEGSIALSNVMLIDSESGKPSRVRIQREDGRRVRVFAKSGQPVPEPNS